MVNTLAAYPIVTLGRFARCSIVSCANPLIYRLSGLWDGLLAGGRVVWKGPLCALCLHVRLAGKRAHTLVAVGRARGGLPVA